MTADDDTLPARLLDPQPAPWGGFVDCEVVGDIDAPDDYWAGLRICRLTDGHDGPHWDDETAEWWEFVR